MSGATGGEPITPARRRCTATSSRTGERCKLAPILGGTVCASHGGRAPRVKAAAARRLAQQAAEREVAERLNKSGPHTLADVLRELLNTAGMAITWRDTLAGAVERLERYSGPDHNGDQRIIQEVILFERAMDRAGKVCELVARLDLDARLVALTERQGNTIAAVISRVLHQADMAPAAREDALTRLVPAELRRVTA